MAALATPVDVASGWRPLSDSELDVAAVLLDRASALIRLHLPDIDTRIGADANLTVVARGVCAEMVKRVLMNPDAWKSEAIDDFRGERDAVVASGLLYLSDLELAQLSPPSYSTAAPHTVSFWG